jgi:hypothetical protein
MVQRLGRQLLVLVLLFILSDPVRAEVRAVPLLEDGTWQTHNMVPIGPNAFRASGGDPYLFTPNFSHPLKSIQGLFLSLSLTGTSASQPMQLFIATDRHGWSEALSFRFTPNPNGKIFLPFRFYGKGKAFREDASLMNVRLDVGECDACVLKVRQALLVQGPSAELLAMVPVDLIEPDVPVPMAMAADISQKGDWVLRDIDRDGEGLFRVSGGDPYLISPKLNVPLSQVKGVQFRIEFPGQSGYRKMQLFWSSYSHHYEEERSIWFKAALENGIADLFIPVVDAVPKGDLIRNMRLDLVDASGMSFRLLAARLVASPDPSLLQRTPVRMVYARDRRYDRDRLVSDTIHRISGDKAFFVLLGVMIMAVTVTMIWLRWGGTGRFSLLGRRRKSNGQG